MQEAEKARNHRWSSEIRKRDNEHCVHCNSTACSPHHIIPRGCKRTKYLKENGVLSCEFLHRRLEGKDGMNKKMKAVRIYIGLERYDNLEKIKNEVAEAGDFEYTEVK